MSELFDYDVDKNWLTKFRKTSETFSFNASTFVETRNDRFLRMLGMDKQRAIREAIPESLYYWFGCISFESEMSVDIYPHFKLYFEKLGFVVSYEGNLHVINASFLGLENWICNMAERAKRDIECKFKEKENIMPTKSSSNLTFSLSGNLYMQPATPKIEKVIFNDPATIILWKDGTKTIVKVKSGEKFDKWTGFAMAYMKKLKGDNFHAFFRKWCEDKKDEK